MRIPEKEEEEECWLGTAPLSPQWSLETRAEVSSSLGSPPFLDKGCLIAEGCRHPPPSGSDGKAGRLVRSRVTIAPCAGTGS